MQFLPETAFLFLHLWNALDLLASYWQNILLFGVFIVGLQRVDTNIYNLYRYITGLHNNF